MHKIFNQPIDGIIHQEINVTKLYSILLLCTLASACGSGGSSDPSSGGSSNPNVSAWDLPSEPGGASNATIAGIDSNNNGLRDDIELRIYDSTESDIERSSMMVAAREMSKSLTNLDVTMSSDEIDAAMSRGISCLSQGRTISSVKNVAFIEALIANTPEREAAYRTYNETRGGTIGSMARYDASECSSFIPVQVGEQP